MRNSYFHKMGFIRMTKGLIIGLLIMVVLSPSSSTASNGIASSVCGGNSAPSTSAPINLALHKSYTIATTAPDEAFASGDANYPDGGKLTDGVFGSDQGWWSAGWLGWARQDTRQIVIDLESVSTVNSIRMRFFQERQSAVLFPSQVKFELSTDRVNWFVLGNASAGIPNDQEGTLTEWITLPDLNHAGRYIRVTVPVRKWVFADEIEVSGHIGKVNNAVQPIGSPDNALNKGYLDSDTRQILIYTGYNPANPDFVNWTAEHFKPYAGYVDVNGTIQDTMFNSFLFLPFEAAAPSGNRYDGAGGTTRADWQYFLDQLFASGKQIDALNDAVGEVRTALGNTLFTPTVYISIPYPAEASTGWGDINQDGVVDELDGFKPGTNVDEVTALNNRAAAIQWYVDEVESRFAAGLYSNLKLEGFYWLSEAIDYEFGPNEMSLLQQVSDLLHNQNYKFEWIPYYQASGFQDWEQAGFDAALMQPNHMFDQTSYSRITGTANLAKRFGMGIEIEMDATMHLQGERDRYYDYLDGGVEYGYMNGAYLAWYDWVKHLHALSGSIYGDIREVYDETYRFIKGTYVARACRVN
ncbi:DUF4855 domain-containing protein [Paenibacillus sp. IITD108]|uniref:DUF4855 domain-containing protein n=1 Tax=Paenibacillus sp. IITD108 TaxID=3116649 RepID=UPI002F41C4AA